MSVELPSHAQIVVIGGGIVGCSVAYHLTKLGRTDDWITSGKYEIEVEGRMVPVGVHLRSPYDPGNERPKI